QETLPERPCAGRELSKCKDFVGEGQTEPVLAKGALTATSHKADRTPCVAPSRLCPLPERSGHTLLVALHPVNLGSQIFNVNVGCEAQVVREIPAGVIGTLVNHDVVAVPEPVAAKAKVEWGDMKVESSEPEAVGPAANQSPDVTAPEAAGKVAVLPGMVEVI